MFHANHLLDNMVFLLFNSLYAGYFFMLLLPSADFFKINFFKKNRVSNSLDPDKDRHFVGPYLGPNFSR